MKADRLIASLGRFPELLAAALGDITPEIARWKPADGAWSMLEVVCHLGDEEVHDFRTRVKRTLENPESDWPPIDPVGWATERRYNEGDLSSALARFTAERAASITWLRSLREPDWQRAHHHPKFGPMQAGMIFASWAAHDMLHLRQIVKRRFQLIERDSGAFSTRYAGEWTA